MQSTDSSSTLPFGQDPDSAWLNHLALAIQQGDHPAIWGLMEQHIGNDIAHQLLADEVCRAATPSAAGTAHTELYLVPVIAPNDAGVFNSPDRKSVV